MFPLRSLLAEETCFGTVRFVGKTEFAPEASWIPKAALLLLGTFREYRPMRRACVSTLGSRSQEWLGVVLEEKARSRLVPLILMTGLPCYLQQLQSVALPVQVGKNDGSVKGKS